MDLLRVSSEIESLIPYKPGQSVDQTRRELGLSDIVKLASNENPLGPSPRAVAALQKAASELHRYPDPTSFELVQKLANKAELTTEQVLVGNGSNELIDLLIRTFCEPRVQKILISECSFVAYQVCAQAARVQVVQVPQLANFKINVQMLAQTALSDPNISILFLPNPNNPTGTYVTQDELTYLLDTLKSWSGLIAIDEAYLDFARASDYPRALEFMKRYKNVAVMHTFSKAYGLAGLRLGAIYGPKDVIGYLHRVRNPFNVNNLVQAAALAALSDAEYLQASQKVVWDGLDYFYQKLSQLKLRYWESQGNFVMFDSGMDGEVFFKRVLQQGVILRPLGPYGLKSLVRMSVGTMDENKKAMAAIEKVFTGGGK